MRSVLLLDLPLSLEVSILVFMLILILAIPIAGLIWLMLQKRRAK